MVYTSVGILESALELAKETLGSLSTTGWSIYTSISLMTIVLLHCKRCTARKRAAAKHSHTSQEHRLSASRSTETAHASCQSGQALVGTCEKRGKHGDSLSQGTPGGRDYTLCYDRITPHRAFRQQQRQRISVGRTKLTNAAHSPCGSSWHKLRGVSSNHRRTMRARRQPRRRRQGSLAGAGTHVWRTCT